MQIAWLNVRQTAKQRSNKNFQVNLRAVLGHRSLRHGALGTDLDGRVYYVLSPRSIDDDARPPSGWASGLLVWGIGVPRKPEVEADGDELPIQVERWSHFGKSGEVKQLVKWIEWRTKKAVESARPPKSPAKPKATPNGKLTPKAISAVKASAGKLVQSTLQASPSKALMTKSSTRLEVVIPSSAKKAASSDSSLSSLSSGPIANGFKPKSRRTDDDALSDTSSGLSTPPVSSVEDLLTLHNPKGYKPSAAKIEEDGKELARRSSEVAEWLEVLEWKGMGEVY